MKDTYQTAPDLVLGTRLNERVPVADQGRQRAEVVEILRRLRSQPGVVLADEVGMGKTFVALGVAYCVAASNPRGPVILMVPPNLVDKWEQDLNTFCELYLADRKPVSRNKTTVKQFRDRSALRYGIARHSVQLLKLLDDPAKERCHLIFLAQGSMGRRQTDKWVRLALISEALRRHGRGGAKRLIQVKMQIHRFLGKLIHAIGEEKAHGWGDELWRRLLKTSPEVWRETYNKLVQDERNRLNDDPVPKAIVRGIRDLDLKPLAAALEGMPIRTRGGDERLAARLAAVRTALKQVEENLWKKILATARWRSPLLVLDEAHHLKNPGTQLARRFQSPESEADLKIGDGALAHVFDRMLFLTATPFQLGHHELVKVLERFGDVRWDASSLGDQSTFNTRLQTLSEKLDDSQRAAIGFQRSWSRLEPDDVGGDPNGWWLGLLDANRDTLSYHQRAAVDGYDAAKHARDEAQTALRPWIVRHNKGTYWASTSVRRRLRLDGASIIAETLSSGLSIPGEQLLPFFLAARSAVKPGQDLLGEALCSSYEAFRFTRRNRKAGRDEQDDQLDGAVVLSHAGWYLGEFDRSLENASGSAHPKINATVNKAVDLWEAGEKVLVFAFYRYTCRYLRLHISQEIEQRIMKGVKLRLIQAGQVSDSQEVERLLESAQNRYFDDLKSPGRKAVDQALTRIMELNAVDIEAAALTHQQIEDIEDVMRRFLRVKTTLARCFPIEELEAIEPDKAIARMLTYRDASEVSWQDKFHQFVGFITRECASEERRLFLEACQRTQTGAIRVKDEDQDEEVVKALANVQSATGDTDRDQRARLMRAFNTPFFPDVLVCSEVMGEGVDLQRFCRHVIHHDLAWNPSTIEQRTGRIDRLGCKAEGRHPIHVYLPYLAGAADERQYRVMSDRESWFRIVMGQEEVARLVSPESGPTVPLPSAIADSLTFQLGLSGQ